MSFSLVDILLIIILSQGIFLTLAIQLVPNKNKAANTILTYLLIIASIMLFGRIAMFRLRFEELLRVATFVDTTLFLFGPLLYCYIRRLAFQEEQVFHLRKIHFLPMLIYLCYFVWTFTMNTSEFNTSYMDGSLNLAFILTELFGLLSISFYTYRSFTLYKKLVQDQKRQISYNQGVTRYIMFLLIALGIFIMLWLYSFFSFYIVGNFSPYVNYNTMWLSTSVFMYFIGFYSLTQPQIFRIPLKNSNTKRVQKNRIKKEEIEELELRLRDLIEIEKSF